jgi:recombination protein RecA
MAKKITKEAREPEDNQPAPAASSREAALNNAIANIEKQFGKGSIMRLGANVGMRVETIGTGAITIDAALGVGGLPRGRVIEIYGPESGGKTTIALHVVAEMQKIGGTAAFVDAEHALDPKYARALGVDIDALLISQPDTGEQALEIVEALVRSGAVDIIVVDSVAALVPQKEIEGEMGDSHVGLHARLMSQALRKLTAAIGKTQCTVIFINQIREKIGVMFGNPETTTGGRALRFYASVRLEVRRIEGLKDKNGIEAGNRVKIKVAKNKVAPPFRVAEVEIWFGEGLRKEVAMLELAAELGHIEKSGAWYAYEGVKIGQGKENSSQYLKDNPEAYEKLSKLIRSELFGD